MNIYDELGVRRIINAKGPATRVSGGFLAPEVTAAMTSAASHCVDMADLQARASLEVAAATGAEAGLVTAGAAAGLLLGAAASIARLDPARMARLPDTRGLPNEIVMVRSQRNFYDHAVRATGARIREVGLPDRFAGAGVRDAEPWEIAEAITPQTAAVLYVAGPLARPALPDVVRVAHERDVPVLVDAAAQLPPASNLRAFIAAGADLVAFSGGKALAGPQGSGILCGRRDLIMSAALQMLDLDIEWDQWSPPPAFIDKSLLPGLPPHGIGRTAKIGKETIVGLLVALRLFLAEGDETRYRRWRALLENLELSAGELRHARLAIRGDVVPKLELHLESRSPLDARALLLALQYGEPSIVADGSHADHSLVLFNPLCLRETEIPLIAHRLRELLA